MCTVALFRGNNSIKIKNDLNIVELNLKVHNIKNYYKYILIFQSQMMKMPRNVADLAAQA